MPSRGESVSSKGLVDLVFEKRPLRCQRGHLTTCPISGHFPRFFLGEIVPVTWRFWDHRRLGFLSNQQRPLS